MEYCSLMSGSWGNCHYIEANGTNILIDAGQSGKRILDHMAWAGCCLPSALSAIVVTHAHRDHVLGVGILARRLQIPIYATEGAWFEMDAIIDKVPAELKRTIDSEEKWTIGSLRIEAYPTSHDALESVGFVVRQGDETLGIATDTGVFTRRMERALQEAQLLVLEANHDLEMLRDGKYPYYLKKRIAGIDGHLSNEDAGAALLRIAGSHLRKVMLAHLSEENNTWEKAYATACRDLGPDGPDLFIAPRKEPSCWISVCP